MIEIRFPLPADQYAEYSIGYELGVSQRSLIQAMDSCDVVVATTDNRRSGITTAIGTYAACMGASANEPIQMIYSDSRMPDPRNVCSYRLRTTMSIHPVQKDLFEFGHSDSVMRFTSHSSLSNSLRGRVFDYIFMENVVPDSSVVNSGFNEFIEVLQHCMISRNVIRTRKFNSAPIDLDTPITMTTERVTPKLVVTCYPNDLYSITKTIHNHMRIEPERIGIVKMFNYDNRQIHQSETVVRQKY